MWKPREVQRLGVVNRLGHVREKSDLYRGLNIRQCTVTAFCDDELLVPVFLHESLSEAWKLL